MSFFFVDESGYQGNFIFAAVKVDNPELPNILLKEWRRWRKGAKISYETNEYHDTNMTDRERKKMLWLISKEEEIKAWGVQKYNFSVKEHAGVVVELLKYADIGEYDVVTIDKLGIKKVQEKNYIKKVKKMLGMKNLNISFKISEREKGIQLVDSLAGALSREYIPRGNKKSYFEVVSFKFEKDIIKI